MIRTPIYLEKQEGFFASSGKKATLNFKTDKKYDYLLSLIGAAKPEYNGGEDYTLIIGDAELKSDECFEGNEAYHIEISESGIAISANAEAGISQALKLLALMYMENGGKIPCAVVDDYPEVEFRGTHLCIFNPLDGTEKDRTDPEDTLKRLKMLSLAGYNYVFIEFWGMFPYKKRPYACWPHSAYTREVVENIISYAIDDLHITPLPCQNLTSHAGWSRIASRKHVVLDQRPDLADMWIPGGWCFATENPDTKEFLKDIMDDLIETFRNPPFLHASCDKCFGFGSSEEDRTKPADALFATHICNLNSYLQHKGVRMVMWGDMLYSSMDALYWKADERLANSIPKNILINLWTHNDVGTHWADVDFFESKGFETIYSPFINRDGAKSMVNICKQKESLGILQTTWHRPDASMNTVIYTAGLCWSGVAAEDAEIENFIKNV